MVDAAIPTTSMVRYFHVCRSSLWELSRLTVPELDVGRFNAVSSFLCGLRPGRGSIASSSKSPNFLLLGVESVEKMENLDQFLLLTGKKICDTVIAFGGGGQYQAMARQIFHTTAVHYSVLSQDKDRTTRVVRRLRSDFTHFLLLSSR